MSLAAVLREYRGFGRTLLTWTIRSPSSRRFGAEADQHVGGRERLPRPLVDDAVRGGDDGRGRGEGAAAELGLERILAGEARGIEK